MAEFKVAITPEIPLVGFHARSDDIGLTKLGLILVDTVSPECQRSQPNGDMGLLEGLTPEAQA